MQEINLLKNRLKDTTFVWERRNRLLITLLSIFLAVVVGAVAVLYFLSNNLINQIDSVRAENVQIQSDINSHQAELKQAQSFQAQLKNMDKMLAGHLFWSKFFDEFSKLTFTRTQFVNVVADTQGKIHAEGRVGSYTDLGKAILGLSTSDYFSNLKLLSSEPASEEFSGYSFSLEFLVSPEVFKKN